MLRKIIYSALIGVLIGLIYIKTTMAYEIQNYQYQSQYTTGSDHYDVQYNSSGSIMHVLSGNTDSRVRSFNLSIPYDPTSATSNLAPLPSQGNIDQRAFHVKADGTKSWIMNANGDRVRQYTLSTPNLFNTATIDAGIELIFVTQENSPTSMDMTQDGTKIYILGNQNKTVYQYTLPTPYSLTGSSYSALSFNPSAQTANPSAVALSTDGTKMYISDGLTRIIYQYNLATPYNISTAIYSGTSLDVSSSTTSGQMKGFDIDNDHLLISHNTPAKIVYYEKVTPVDPGTGGGLTDERFAVYMATIISLFLMYKFAMIFRYRQ